MFGCPIIPLLSSAGIDAYHSYRSDLLCSLYSKKEKKQSEKFLTIKGSAASLCLGCSTASDTTFLSRRLWTRDTDHDLICIRLTKPPTSYGVQNKTPRARITPLPGPRSPLPCLAHDSQTNPTHIPRRLDTPHFPASHIAPVR